MTGGIVASLTSFKQFVRISVCEPKVLLLDYPDVLIVKFVVVAGAFLRSNTNRFVIPVCCSVWIHLIIKAAVNLSLQIIEVVSAEPADKNIRVAVVANNIGIDIV